MKGLTTSLVIINSNLSNSMISKNTGIGDFLLGTVLGLIFVAFVCVVVLPNAVRLIIYIDKLFRRLSKN